MNERQPMPVFAALKQPGRRVYMGSDQADWFFTQDGNSEVFDVCKRVWFGQAPDVSDILAAGIKSGSGKKLREAVGPQRLPFTDMWLEGQWSTGSTGYIEGAIAYAIYAHSNDARDPETLRPLDLETTSYQIWALMADGSIMRMPLCVVNIVDQEGLVEGSTVKGLDPERGFVLEIPRDDTLMSVVPIGMVMPAMWAIGLMNCRNIRLDEKTTEKTSRKQRRPRPGISYHTIVLPNHSPSGGAPTGNRNGESVVAQHQVRGHFKTFTDEAPLLGKHTGTYWWGWQVRGSKKNGVVVSDYKVGADV